MGTATEQSLRNILAELESDTLPTDAATQTTLAALLTELQAKLETADLNLDATKDLQVDVKTMPTTTVITGSGEKLFGFGGIVEQALVNTNLSAGTNSLSGTAVPAGEIHVITTLSLRYDGTSPTRMFCEAAGLAGGLGLHLVESPSSGAWYGLAVQLILQAGDVMKGWVEGATAGDDLYVRYAGYKLAAP